MHTLQNSLSTYILIHAEAPDLKSLSHQLTAAYTTQPSPTTSITTTTTQASLVLDYSSSGPTLEQHSLNNDDTHANADGLKEGGIRVPFVYESEASTTSSSGVPSPYKDPVELREVKCDAQVSYSQSISSSTPPEASLSPNTLTLSAPKVDTPPGCLQEHNTCDHTLHSETSSLHVEVDDVSAPQLSETAHSSEGDSPRHSLTDVSTCSSRDESTLSAVEQQQQCDGMKDEGTITTATVSNQPLLKSGKGKGIEHERETSEGSNNREGGGEHATVQTTGVSRSVFLHSCSISEVTAHQVPNAHVGGMKNDGQEIGAIVNDTESVSRLPGNPSSQCSHSAAHDRPAELPPVTTAKEQLLQPLTNTSRWVLYTHYIATCTCTCTCVYVCTQSGEKSVLIYTYAPVHEFSLPACSSVRLSVCLSVYLSVYLSVCLSICLSVRPSVCLSVCLSVCHTHTHTHYVV